MAEVMILLDRIIAHSRPECETHIHLIGLSLGRPPTEPLSRIARSGTGRIFDPMLEIFVERRRIVEW
jgi:hypothetical protein